MQGYHVHLPEYEYDPGERKGNEEPTDPPTKEESLETLQAGATKRQTYKAKFGQNERIGRRKDQGVDSTVVATSFSSILIAIVITIKP